eukprot:CAMPEP_0167775864 /NCGR_PEP_ID=MMETSP0111_2-20121227/2798_1 /TAXON_ID=91324 /ORGANISM="Lotharella globosa, Strain CCCM811" /LENGTH=67 /DNA_ID=CAMNT_0007665831 /DNA_START=30 /DNA_END=233 /DNA_ORIENTATION=-
MPGNGKASMKFRNKAFSGNIEKRGQVSKGREKPEKYPLGPYAIGFFLFVVVGSAIFQVIRVASQGAF